MAIHPLLKLHLLQQILDRDRARLLHLAADLDRPRLHLHRLRRLPQVLAVAELVIVVVGGRVLLGRDGAARADTSGLGVMAPVCCASGRRRPAPSPRAAASAVRRPMTKASGVTSRSGISQPRRRRICIISHSTTSYCRRSGFSAPFVIATRPRCIVRRRRMEDITSIPCSSQEISCTSPASLASGCSQRPRRWKSLNI